MGKDCAYVPQAFVLAVMHGSPDQSEGCAEEYGDVRYTDDYTG